MGLLRRLFGLEPPKARPYTVTFSAGFKPAETSPNQIRVDEEPPEGFGRKLHAVVKVVGTSYRRDEVDDFINGKNRSVYLEREPDNPADRNAVKVMGRYELYSREWTEQLGYLPKGMGAKLPDGPIAATVRTLYESDDEKSGGIRIDIWVPRAKPKPRAPRQAKPKAAPRSKLAETRMKIVFLLKANLAQREIGDRLAVLFDLKDRGMLTEQEFSAAKIQLIRLRSL